MYVVLEAHYQSALTKASTALNSSGGGLGIELSGDLIEELRDGDNYAGFHAAAACCNSTMPTEKLGITALPTDAFEENSVR